MFYYIEISRKTLKSCEKVKCEIDSIIQNGSCVSCPTTFVSTNNSCVESDADFTKFQDLDNL